MTEYICYCCEYSTKIRTHYQRHLSTKKHIKNSNQENEKGIKEAILRLNPKLFIISGTNGPMILVRNEITKKVTRINTIRIGFFFIF